MSQNVLINALTLIFGLILGSFNNVLIYRIPKGISLGGRSKCPKCDSQINWQNNIPLFSYLIQKGRCGSCNSKISLDYPITEIVTALAVLIIAALVPSYSIKIALSFFTSFGIALSVIDWRIYRLPNVITYSLFIILNLFLLAESLITKDWHNYLRSLLISILAVIFFLCISIIAKGGMGMGDVKFAASIGLITGYFGFLLSYFAFLFCFALGAAYGIWLMLTRKGNGKTKVAFGTFMFLGSYLVLIFKAYL